MTTNPPGEPGPDTGAGGDAGPPPRSGPRVTAEEIKDLGRLRRSTTDSKVAGVAAGIARHLDIDPLVVRIAFVVLALFGGGGILLYGACWLFVPEDRTNQAVVNVDERSRTVVLAIAAALAALAAVGDTMGGPGFPWPLAVVGGIAVIWVLTKGTQRAHPSPDAPPGPADRTEAPDPSGTAPPPGSGGPYGPVGPTYAGYQPPPPRRPADPTKRGPVLFWFAMGLAALAAGVVLMLQLAGIDVPDAAYPAVVMATCGAMLVVGAVYGRAGGLIAVGLVATLLTGLASVAGEIEAGHIQKQPTAAADLESSYDLGAGEIKLDLTDIEDLEELDGDTLDLEVIFGRIEVVVPEEGLDVNAGANVDFGEVLLFGDRSTSSDSRRHDGGDDAPVLTIDADVAFGQIQFETEESTP